MALGDIAPGNEEKEDEQEDDEPIEVEAREVEPPESENALLQPVSDIEDVVGLYSNFEEIKSDLLTKGDKTKIGRGVHINKSGWRKIATAFNVSVEVVSKEVTVDNDVVYAEVDARAVAPNGKAATGTGVCASNESTHMQKMSENENEKPEMDGVDPSNIIWKDGAWRRILPPKEVDRHNLVATAATRAKNRAISDCVGGGEVSAEELTAEDVIG